MPEQTPKSPLYVEDAHPTKFLPTPQHLASSPSPSSSPLAPPPVVQQDNSAPTDDASQGQEQDTKASKGLKDQADSLRQAVQALLNSVQGDGGNDQPFGDREDFVEIDGEEGEKIYVIVDDAEVSVESNGHVMDNEGQEGAGKLGDFRKKLTDMVKKTGSITLDKVLTEVEVLRQHVKEDEEEEEESVPETHDEL